MDFSAVCLDGVLGMGATNNNQLKHCRSASEMDLEQTTSRDQDWRSSGKMARTESYLMRSASMLSDASHNTTSDLLEAAEQQASRLMRSDSVVSPYNKGLSGLPFGGYQYSTSNKPSAVLPVAVSNGANGMHGMFSGARMSPFTPSQWQELEHQALIFKYMMAGVQVPPELLIPIRKNHSLNIFSSLSSPGVGSLRPNLGWSSFHLGFANNADPEPGRCRRTDGKKWRCSRDAVPEQKYCERHMNRGRHRSRKPVEGQTTNQTSSHAASTGGAANISSSATTTSLAAARSALNPTNSNTTINNNSNTSSLSNLRHHSQQQQQQQQQQHQIAAKHSTFAASIDASATPFQIPLNVDRYLNGMKGDIAGQIFESQSQSMNSSLFNDNAWRSRMVQPAAKTMSFETRTLVDEAPDFGLGQMNLLPMTTQRNESQQQRPAGIRHFFDDWPTTTTTRDRSSALSWSEIEHMRTAAAASTTTSASSATQLSISIPSDFSSPASPNDKLTLSPLKLSTTRSDDLLGVDMGLGVGMGLGIEPDHHRQRQQQQQNHHHQHNHHQQQHTNWIPITWESPVGGPLAEVLNSTTATPSAKNSSSSSSALNLMTGDGWDCSSTSPGRGDTSPTGVLQKTFGSLSDSSTGSSPRAINIKADSAGLCENLRTAAFVTAAAQISTT